MDEQEKAYIDKKFSEPEQKLINPNPDEALTRARTYAKHYYKRYAVWGIAAVCITIAAMLASFYWVGLL